MGSPLPLHPENRLGGDDAKIKITDLSRITYNHLFKKKQKFLDVGGGRLKKIYITKNINDCQVNTFTSQKTAGGHRQMAPVWGNKPFGEHL